MEKTGMLKDLLEAPHGSLRFPVFMPDATFGFVRSLDSEDLERCGVQALVMNVFHLMQHPGSSVIKALGGLHSLSGWSKPIVTDSGGFQAYSIIRSSPKMGRITSKGIIFHAGSSGRRMLLTPEKSIRLQLMYGSDIVICLDVCTHVDDPVEAQIDSVEKTVGWAERCRLEFDRIVSRKYSGNKRRPLLFAVIQGGGSRDLRRECAEALLEIGFDGFCYGGYPLDGEGNLLVDMLRYTRRLVPSEFPMIALGVGHPKNIVRCLELGYMLFDSSLPTRDARQGRLYTFKPEKVCSYIHIQDEKYIRSKEPVSQGCDCLTCRKYTLGYLHHLFRMKDPLYSRLASIHNLRFIINLIGNVRMRR